MLGLSSGSRAAVLRRSEETRSSSPSADEVGGPQSAIRSERSEQLNRAASLAGERVPQPPENTAAVLLHGDLRPGFVAKLGQLA
jgi:hypothetical protein